MVALRPRVQLRRNRRLGAAIVVHDMEFGADPRDHYPDTGPDPFVFQQSGRPCSGVGVRSRILLVHPVGGLSPGGRRTDDCRAHRLVWMARIRCRRRNCCGRGERGVQAPP